MIYDPRQHPCQSHDRIFAYFAISYMHVVYQFRMQPGWDSLTHSPTVLISAPMWNRRQGGSYCEFLNAQPFSTSIPALKVCWPCLPRDTLGLRDQGWTYFHALISHGLSHPSKRLIYYCVAKVISEISYALLGTSLRIQVIQGSRHEKRNNLLIPTVLYIVLKDSVIVLLQHLTVAVIIAVISRIVQHISCVLSFFCLSDNYLAILNQDTCLDRLLAGLLLHFSSQRLLLQECDVDK